jgi:hypothetical protein
LYNFKIYYSFEFSNLDDRHILSIAKGPLIEAIQSYSEYAWNEKTREKLLKKTKKNNYYDDADLLKKKKIEKKTSSDSLIDGDKNSIDSNDKNNDNNRDAGERLLKESNIDNNNNNNKIDNYSNIIEVKTKTVISKQNCYFLLAKTKDEFKNMFDDKYGNNSLPNVVNNNNDTSNFKK